MDRDEYGSKNESGQVGHPIPSVFVEEIHVEDFEGNTSVALTGYGPKRTHSYALLQVAPWSVI
jgi:hypothetical protein